MTESNRSLVERRELEARDKELIEREGMRPGPVFRPDVDIVEKEDAYWLSADLPGVDESHVNIRLEEGVLTLDASLATEPSAGWTPLHQEYRYGGWRRQFALSEEIDAERIEARMRDGVLTLELPKAERMRPRRIEVHAG